VGVLPASCKGELMLWNAHLRRAMRSGAVALLAVSSSIALLHGCGGDDEESSQNLESFDGLYSVYLKNCAGACHAPGRASQANAPNLDLSSADAAYASLQNPVDLGRTTLCLSLRYVTAGKPEQSFLVALLDPTVNAAFQAETGTNCDPKNHTIASGGEADNPSAAVLEGLKGWIRAGAVR
jgi:hypothetical protein